MIRRTARDRLVFLLLTSVACSSSDDGGEEGGTEIDAETYGTELPAKICEQVLACDCDHGWADAEACANTLEGALAEIAAWADERGLEYHPECGGAHLDFLDALACGGEIAECGELCEPWTGSAGDGEACEASISNPFRVDTCVEGFVCMGGFCSATCPDRPGEGEACSGVTSCQDGLYCAADETCTPTLPEGSPCTIEEQACAEGTVCSDELECTALLEPGEPCMAGFECTTGLCDPDTDTCLPLAPAVCQFDH